MAPTLTSIQQRGVQCRDLMAMHALSGSDTTSYPFEKWTMAALKILLNVEFHCIGNLESSSEEIVDVGQFIFYFFHG